MPFLSSPPSALSLPRFRSIALRGRFPASAVVYLCLSHLEELEDEDGTVVVLTPSRQLLAEALKNAKDTWLLEHGGDGAVASRLARVRVL
jgi:hypothetical protein